MRSERWPNWAIGLMFGAAAGFMVLVGGAPFLIVSLAFLVLAFVLTRSLAFLSGAFIGVGGLWAALMIRAQLACNAFDAAPNQGCQGFGVGQFVIVSAVILGIGLLVGVLAWRRRAAELTSRAES
jgi:hypothetical protein